jgi:hypothetical protein
MPGLADDRRLRDALERVLRRTGCPSDWTITALAAEVDRRWPDLVPVGTTWAGWVQQVAAALERHGLTLGG